MKILIYLLNRVLQKRPKRYRSTLFSVFKPLKYKVPTYLICKYTCAWLLYNIVAAYEKWSCRHPLNDVRIIFVNLVCCIAILLYVICMLDCSINIMIIIQHVLFQLIENE